MDTNETLLARIDERTLAILEKIEAHLKRDDEVHEDLESRMRTQERFRYLLLGAAALVTSGGGGLVTYLLQ